MPGHIPKNLSVFLRNCGQKFPDRAALQIKKNGRYEILTYRDLVEKSARLSQGLYKLGVRKADRVAIISENSPEWVIAYFAILALGAVAVPIDPKLTEKELVRLLNDCEPAAVFCHVSLESTISRNTQVLDFVSYFISMESDEKENGSKWVSFQNILSEKSEYIFDDVDQNNLAVLIYTSGTTGKPKGVMLSHGNILYYPCLVAYDTSFIKKDERILMILPFHHIYPANVLLAGLATGAVFTLLKDLKPSEIFSVLQENKISAIAGIPRLYELFCRGILEKISEQNILSRQIFQKTRILSRFLQKIFGAGVSKLLFMRVHRQFGGYIRSLSSGGAPLKSEIFELLKDLGFWVQEGYGLTETSGCIALNPSKRVRRGSAGIALSNTYIKIDTCQEDGLGEILVSGPSVFQGYFKDKETTVEVLKNGWFFTGDIGRIDKEGYLFIAGRKKDIIVLPTGKKVYPDEIESLYGQSAFIKQITVIGLNRGQGEEVFACIVPRQDKGQTLSAEMMELRIKEHLMEVSKTLSPHKRIGGYKLLGDEISISLTKIKKYELRKRLESDSLSIQTASKESLLENDFQQIFSRLLKKYIKRTDQILQPQTHLEMDLGVDSLGRAELMTALKNTFNLDISEKEASALQTVGDIATLLKSNGVLLGIDQMDSLKEVDWGSILEQETPEMAQTMQKVFNTYPRARRVFLKLSYRTFRSMVRLAVTGLEHLPDSGPYILALNHESHLDNLFLACFLSPVLQEKLAVISKKEHFEHGFTRFFARLCHAVPVDRENVSAEDLKIASYLLKQGKILIVHPEGTRSSDGQLLPFKNGVALLALHHQCPIVPVFIEGAHEYWPKDSLFPKFRGNISVHIGKCIDSKEFGAFRHSGTLIQTADELTRVLRSRMLGIKEQMSFSRVATVKTEEKEAVFTDRIK